MWCDASRWIDMIMSTFVNWLHAIAIRHQPEHARFKFYSKSSVFSLQSLFLSLSPAWSSVLSLCHPLDLPFSPFVTRSPFLSRSLALSRHLLHKLFMLWLLLPLLPLWAITFNVNNNIPHQVWCERITQIAIELEHNCVCCLKSATNSNPNGWHIRANYIEAQMHM